VSQPKAGSGGQDLVIVVRGIISRDGKVREAVVQNSKRPDLNPEALSVIQKWLFTPALCNGHPATSEASFTLHFQGR
jgi:TonB family protein